MSYTNATRTFAGYPIVERIDTLERVYTGMELVRIDHEVCDILESCDIPPDFANAYPALLMRVVEGEMLALYGIEDPSFNEDDLAYLLWASYEKFDDNLV
jgi:hypothetical protein